MGRRWNGRKLNELPMKCKSTDTVIFTVLEQILKHMENIHNNE